MRALKILALTSYPRQGASSRLRVHQFVPYLEQLGFTCHVCPLVSEEYLSLRYEHPWTARTKAIGSVRKRVRDIMAAGQYDVVWLQREAVPWLPPVLERWLSRRGIPYVVDYDDAVFHAYDSHDSKLVRSLLGNKIDVVMKNATSVIVGNDYLSDRAYKSGASSVVKIPTVIDLSRYQLKAAPSVDKPVTIGWIGTPVTAKFLSLVEEPLRQASREVAIRLVTVGAGNLTMKGVDVENVAWSESTEVDSIKRFDVGIMPLEDALWERGKCGYKIIQYMACGVPAIASPVGVNSEIITHAHNGWLAATESEWCRYLIESANNRANLVRMGAEGRKLVESKYSIAAVIDNLADVFRHAAKRTASQV